MVTAVGSYSATAPINSGQWIMQMVAFRTPTVPPTVTSVSPNSGTNLGGQQSRSRGRTSPPERR